MKELDGYIINNPFYDSEPLKHTFMRNAYLVYRKIRTCLAYFFPLSEMQKILWENDHIPFASKPNAVSISAVSTGSFDSITIVTSTETIKFFGISNKNELCEHISKLLADCQRRAFTQSTANEGTAYADTQANEEIIKAVKTAICAQLKSPASAQFPVDMITIVGDETRGYHITGFVDSQNSYGAMIRNDFAADVAIENGCPVVKSSSVAANANKARAKAFGVNYIALLIIVGVVGVLLYFLISMMVGL